MRDASLSACGEPSDCFLNESCLEGLCVTSEMTRWTMKDGDDQHAEPPEDEVSEEVASGNVRLVGPRATISWERSEARPVVLGYLPNVDYGTLALYRHEGEGRGWSSLTVSSLLRWSEEQLESASIYPLNDEFHVILYLDFNETRQGVQTFISFYNRREHHITESYADGAGVRGRSDIRSRSTFWIE